MPTASTSDMPHGAYTISSDPARVDLDVVHGYLTTSYWATGITREVVARSIANSLCFGAYLERQQVGFARVITDRATFAYLADVFVLEEHRGSGLGKALVAAALAHPELTGLRRWTLFTKDGHGLYERFGFRSLAKPQSAMELKDDDVYRRADEAQRV